MFGYCDNDRCPLDLWAPEGGAITNRAFSGYAMMMSNLDNIVNNIVDEITRRCYEEGYNEPTIEVTIPEDLNDWEVEYVSQKVYERIRNSRW